MVADTWEVDCLGGLVWSFDQILKFCFDIRTADRICVGKLSKNNCSINWLYMVSGFNKKFCWQNDREWVDWFDYAEIHTWFHIVNLVSNKLKKMIGLVPRAWFNNI